MKNTILNSARYIGRTADNQPISIVLVGDLDLQFFIIRLVALSSLQQLQKYFIDVRWIPFQATEGDFQYFIEESTKLFGNYDISYYEATLAFYKRLRFHIELADKDECWMPPTIQELETKHAARASSELKTVEEDVHTRL